MSVLTPDHRLSPPCASRTKSSRSFMFGSFSARGGADSCDVGHPDQACFATTGRVRKYPVTIDLAASRMVVVGVMTLAGVVIKARIRASFTTFQSSTPRAAA